MNSSSSTLKRSLSLPLLTLYGLGTILGAGIYVLIGKVAGIAGLYAPVAFFLASILAAFTGYSFAQLSRQYPKAAGEAYYIEKAFSKRWLSALIGWMVVATGVVSAATIARGFTGYLAVYISLPDWVAITLLLAFLVLVACWGIAESVGLAALITVLELGGLILVLALAGGELQQLPEQWSTLTPPMDAAIWLNIILASFLAFYAFIGFEDMVNVAEEVIDPEINMPKAILIAVSIASILYVVIALIAVLALPLKTLQETEAPMVTLLQPYAPWASGLIAPISLIAVINGALVQMIMGARVIYGMSKQGLAPSNFSIISEKTQTPVRATLLIGAIICVLALIFPLTSLAKITSFIIIGVFALVNAAQVTLYLKHHHGAARTLPWLIPSIGCLLCLIFLTIQLWTLHTGLGMASH